MKSRGAPKGPQTHSAMLWVRRGLLVTLVCCCCLLLAASPATIIPAVCAVADTLPIADVGKEAPAAAAVAKEAAAAAAAIVISPTKVPLTVVGARVALTVNVGGQDLLLGLDTCKEGLRLFSPGPSSCTRRTAAAVALQQKQQQQQQGDGVAVRGKEATLSEQPQGDSAQQHKQPQEQECYDPDLSPSSMWCLNWHEICTAFSEASFNCRPSRQHDPKFASKYKQIVDGVVVAEVRLEGLDSVELTLPQAGMIARGSPGGPLPPSASLRLSNFPVKLVLERDIEFDGFKGLDGVWGIAGPDLCCREASLWNLLVEQGVNAVGFDINLPPATSGAPLVAPSEKPPSVGLSFLHFGKDAKEIFGEMLWAERIQTGAAGFDALVHFSTYDWKLCGEQVGHPLSNNWEVIVDLSSECLVVPPPMWRSLRTWLPVDANHELCKDPDSDEDTSNSSMLRPAVLKGEKGEKVYRRTCPLLTSSGRRTLPSVSFSLSQSLSENPRLQIPLEHLVIHEQGIGEVLCVVPQPFFSMGSEQWRQIRFGTRVLSALNVVMDRVNWRVGLQEKSPQPSSDDSCSTKASCIGDQIYVPYTNRCADPDCSLKILFEMNPDTKVCELAWWVPGAIVTAVAALITLELFILHLRKKVVAEACSGGQ